MSAAKTKVARLESEIEKCRSESNWSKAVDLARQMSSKSQKQEPIVSLVLGESRLERYLTDNPPIEHNIHKANEELPESRKYLLDSLKADPKPGTRIEILLLLAKLQYALGDYSGALSKYDEVNLDNINLENVSNRRLKLLAEAYAIKGLCLDKLPPGSSSKYKQAEKEEQIMNCFERSGDISLVQLQDILDRGKGTPTSVSLPVWGLTDNDATGVGPLVETAIQRSPLLYIRNGELSKGIGRFRDLLSAVETRAIQSLRQTLARQLAEVLLRGVCEKTYIRIEETNDPLMANHTTSPKTRPRKYSGNNLFVPKDQTEETLLLLLIAESMATREAVLNRSPEHSEARLHTFHNTTAVYDLLTVALVKRAQYSMLTETFERAMKFSFDEFHIWYQFALSLICAEKYTRSLLVLQQCMRLNPKHPIVYLHAARICYEHLHMFVEGIEYSKTVLELGEEQPMASKCFLALGVGYSLEAEEAKLQGNRQDLQRKALNAFHRAVVADKNDHLTQFHLALQLAILRQIPEALKHVRKALHIRSDHASSLHLLALLLSAQKQNEEALQLIEAAVAEYPDNFNLLMTKCKLEEVVYGVEEALSTCKHMLKLWKEVYEAVLESEQRGTGLLDRVATSHRSLGQLHLAELSDRDSGSIRAGSIAASRVEHALSEVVSSINSSYQPYRQGPNHSWVLQAQVWLHMAELYLKSERMEEAQACISEAGSIFPISYLVSYMRGRLHEKREELHEAKMYYENAVAINPTHVRSLQHLGMVLHQLGNNHLAEKVLRDAVNAEPTSSVSWQKLGRVLQVLEDFDAAAECLNTSVGLETTSPVTPFTVIPKTLQI